MRYRLSLFTVPSYMSASVVGMNNTSHNYNVDRLINQEHDLQEIAIFVNGNILFEQLQLQVIEENPLNECEN